MGDNLYFCSQCKKVFSSLEDLLFVEDGIPRGFCSEICIENFFSPLVKHYEEMENSLRSSFGLEDEECLQAINNPEYIESTLGNPAEIWRIRNELHEECYVFISHYSNNDGDFSVAILCLIFDYVPSFIFLSTATRDRRLLEELRAGELVEDVVPFLEKAAESGGALVVTQEMIMELENKKSILLAEVLEKRSGKDVPYEEFHLYEEYYRDTIEKPDELYHYKDDYGDNIYTYIKGHAKGDMSFYYFIICVKFENSGEDNGNGTESLLPLLAFPTLDRELYSFFKRGNIISQVMKN